jgi:hypothetical protein
LKWSELSTVFWGGILKTLEKGPFSNAPALRFKTGVVLGKEA